MIVHPAARREVAASAGWYAERSIPLGRRFRLAVAGALEDIEAAPSGFAKAHDEPTMQQAWVSGFPFRVVFFIRQSDGVACVLSVHRKRSRPVPRCRR